MTSDDRLIVLAILLVALGFFGGFLAGRDYELQEQTDKMHQENCTQMRSLNLADESGYCKGW